MSIKFILNLSKSDKILKVIKTISFQADHRVGEDRCVLQGPELARIPSARNS